MWILRFSLIALASLVVFLLQIQHSKMSTGLKGLNAGLAQRLTDLMALPVIQDRCSSTSTSKHHCATSVPTPRQASGTCQPPDAFEWNPLAPVFVPAVLRSEGSTRAMPELSPEPSEMGALSIGARCGIRLNCFVAEFSFNLLYANLQYPNPCAETLALLLMECGRPGFGTMGWIIGLAHIADV